MASLNGSVADPPMAEEEGTKPRAGITPLVVDYYAARPGEALAVSEVSAALGLTAKQVTNVVCRADTPVAHTGQAHHYRYDPEAVRSLPRRRPSRPKGSTARKVVPASAARPSAPASAATATDTRTQFWLVGLTRAGKLVLEDSEGRLVVGEPVI